MAGPLENDDLCSTWTSALEAAENLGMPKEHRLFGGPRKIKGGSKACYMLQYAPVLDIKTKCAYPPSDDKSVYDDSTRCSLCCCKAGASAVAS